MSVQWVGLPDIRSGGGSTFQQCAFKPRSNNRGDRQVSDQHSKIIQIMPAEGWFAVYDADDGDDEDFSPLTAWALFEDQHGDRWLAGIDMNGVGPEGNEPCEADSNFVRYVHASER